MFQENKEKSLKNLNSSILTVDSNVDTLTNNITTSSTTNTIQQRNSISSNTGDNSNLGSKNKKEHVVGINNMGDKVKLNVMGDLGKNLYEKMQKNLNKMLKNTNSIKNDQEDDVKTVNKKDGKILIFYVKF